MSAVRCALPNGYTIEVGTPGEAAYAYYSLKSGTAKKPSTNSVPAEVMARWLKDNAKLRYVIDRSICVER